MLQSYGRRSSYLAFNRIDSSKPHLRLASMHPARIVTMFVGLQEGWWWWSLLTDVFNLWGCQHGCKLMAISPPCRSQEGEKSNKYESKLCFKKVGSEHVAFHQAQLGNGHVASIFNLSPFELNRPHVVIFFLHECFELQDEHYFTIHARQVFKPRCFKVQKIF